MKQFFLICAILLGALGGRAAAEANAGQAARPTLKFAANGKFRIVQFTDLHFDSLDAQDVHRRTFDIMTSVLDREKPQLIVLGGDNVTGKGFYPWHRLLEYMDARQTPFALIFGNHDIENCSYADVVDLMAKSRWFVGAKGPAELPGVGNYSLAVRSADGSGRTSAVVYCLDSHRYSDPAKRYGQYQWITRPQIDWYCRESAHYTEQNHGCPVPSVLFVHKALPEMGAVWGSPWCAGNNGERICYPELNSGLVCAMAENGDIRGVFFGNDHSNDFGGMYFDIGLFFGRASGSIKCKRPGARVIELTDGHRTVDTWITTPEGRESFYWCPAGISSQDEETMPLLKALAGREAKAARSHGVDYTYYEFADEEFRHMADPSKAAVYKTTGTQDNFQIGEPPARRHDLYRLEFETLLSVPETSVYTFATHSDDQSQLWIDGQLVIDNNNYAGYYQRGKVRLEAGLHRMKVNYNQCYWGRRLTVYVNLKGEEEKVLPAQWLYRN